MYQKLSKNTPCGGETEITGKTVKIESLIVTRVELPSIVQIPVIVNAKSG
jgi:hypothetical protein